jgi:hypothetical protein
MYQPARMPWFGALPKELRHSDCVGFAEIFFGGGRCEMVVKGFGCKVDGAARSHSRQLTCGVCWADPVR